MAQTVKQPEKKDVPPNRAIGSVESTLVSNYDELLEGVVAFIIRKIAQSDTKD